MESDKGRQSSVRLFEALLAAALSMVSRARKIAPSAITTGHLALVGQPFPITGFALAMAIELGGRVLRLRGRWL